MKTTYFSPQRIAGFPLLGAGLAAWLVGPSALAQQTGDEVQVMPKVVVSASGFEQDIVDAPASISVITKEDLEGKSFRDVTDALQDIPGVTIEGGPGRKATTAEVSIRGMDSKYTLILVNGKAQGSGQAYYNGEGGGAEFGWLPPLSAIERIEVIRGPMSSLYGSDALGGVINIITKKVVDEWGGSVTVDTVVQEDSDSGNEQQARFYVNGPLIKDKLGVAVYGSRFQRDEDAIASGYRERDKEDATVKLSWTPTESQSLELESGYARQESEGSESKTGGDTYKKMYRRFQALSHEAQWRKGGSSNSFYQREELDNKTQNAVYERETFNTMTTLPMGKHIVTFGGQYRNQLTENPSRAKGKVNLERWDGALFAEDEWYLTDDFSLTGGLRYVEDENYGSEVVPRIYGIYRQTKQLIFKGGVSSGYRTPDLKQGDSDWVEGGGGRSIDGADVGNSDLKPESSVNYEMGVTWSGDSGVNATLTVYHTQFEDKIEKPIICQESSELAYDCSYQGESYQRVYQYQNVDEAEIQGLEMTLALALTKTLSLNGNYTYSDSEQKSGDDKGEPLNNQPKNRVNVGMNWRPAEALKVWGRARYKGETTEGGDSERPAYTFVDTGLSYHLGRGVTTYAGVYNLLDKEVSYEKFGKVLDGRRLNVGVTVDF